MREKYKPSEKQQNCKYALLYSGKHMNQTLCMKMLGEKTESEDEGESYVTCEQCENCEYYKSRYIEYPIVVNGIEKKKLEGWDMNRSGVPVRIKPCGKEYGGKTYLGMYLGELPWTSGVSYNEETKMLTVNPVCNPAIYVFALKKIIFGAESWWSAIENPDDLKDISEEEINSVWYMQMLKGMQMAAEENCEEGENR